MSSLFNTTASFRNETLLPVNASVESAFEFCSHHDALIKMDPDYLSHTDITPADADANTKVYRIVDSVAALKGIWDTSVTVEARITRRKNESQNDTIWVISAPMGLTQTSVWTVVEGTERKAGETSTEGNKRLWLVEETEIKGLRMGVGQMKQKQAKGWKKIHSQWLEQYNEYLKAGNETVVQA